MFVTVLHVFISYAVEYLSESVWTLTFELNFCSTVLTTTTLQSNRGSTARH